MTRKAFIADVAAAAAESIPRISQVKRGAEDGEMDFCYTLPSGQHINVHVLALDVSSYPSQNTFMMYSESQDAPEIVHERLGDLENYSAGLKVSELISQIASELRKALADGSRSNPFSVEDDKMCEDESDYDEEWILDEETQYIRISPEVAAKLDKRIREDLRAVRNAGFRVGVLRGMKADSEASVLSISVQVARLGLSDEAIQGWDLEKQQHVILLIRYSVGYKSYDAIINEAARSHGIDFRVGISNRYKPTVTEALAAFTTISKNDRPDSKDGPAEDRPESQTNESPASFSSLFISSSLNSFMNDLFVSLLKIRHKMGVGWDGAKLFYNDNQGRAGFDTPLVANNFHSNYDFESSPTQKSLPALVTADHVRDTNGDRFSFPLVAMQFFMRYLTRCTEFCLICHDKTQEKFEALKPYVCSKPLCLYQYINLGFGPSLEHEILTQPDVADLLISFCYASVKGRRIREYPTGMSLSVPLVEVPVSIVNSYRWDSRASYPQAVPIPQVSLSTDHMTATSHTDLHKVKYDPIRQEVLLEQDSPCQVRCGDWIVLTTLTDKTQTHHKVVGVLRPTVKLSDAVVSRANPIIIQGQPSLVNTSQSPVTPPTQTPPPVSTMEMKVYNKNFDEFNEQQKAESMIMLLETIPSIAEMRAYLKQQKHLSEPSLQSWTDRISPAALGLLRWIIASNRSCIVQVDVGPSQEENGDLVKKSKPDERVSNMDEYVQFRFAQGAPDKEHRFHQALKETQGRHNNTYPTIFAWHGSRLENWHSIIRSGLDFKDTLNGRACGNGVYHSLDYSTSVGYSGWSSCGTSTWPGSELKITSAMCLNELINAPQEFQCKSPHLVVQYIDWIQCRYLFVQLGNSQIDDRNSVTKDSSSEKSQRNIAEIELDKDFTPKGTNRKPIGIPRTAFPASREFRLKGTDGSLGFSSGYRDAFHTELQDIDDTEDEEDLVFLLSDDESPPLAPSHEEKSNLGWNGKGKGKRVDVVILDPEPRKRAKAQTDFVPDLLDHTSLQILEPPAYATSHATQILTRELKTILKLQDSTPLHELGWYINRNMIQNVYQWIVELHSFEPDLPLSIDMKNSGIKSIVLELRFGKDYPVSPPFVRVIRPRFLPFTMGGGGHVTGGGAMCMELLTNSGWSPVSSIESVLLQVRMAIMNLEPKPARLENQGKHKQRDYGVGEAMEAYVRACRAHGWEVPKDFKEFASARDGNFYFNAPFEG